MSIALSVIALLTFWRYVWLQRVPRQEFNAQQMSESWRKANWR